MNESTLKKEEGAEKGEVKIHTTLTRETRPYRNFHEVIEGWQAAKNQNEMLGALHWGYRVSLEKGSWQEREYDAIDRHIFYLTQADGWADEHLLQLPGDDRIKHYFVGYSSEGHQIYKRPAELRREVAQKAFDMFCLNFLGKVQLFVRGRHGDEFTREWEQTIISERLFPVIQRFYRAQKTVCERIEIRNLSHLCLDEKRSHNEELALEFLVKLAKFILGWREPEILYGSDKEGEKKCLVATCARIDAAKPWMIEILAWLDRIDVLRKWILELDKACLAKLKEIAMRNEFDGYYPSPVRERRPVVTLDEACYLGSKAAWFLKEHELRIREHKRLTAIQEAEKQIKEAGRQIEELAAVK